MILEAASGFSSSHSGGRTQRRVLITRLGAMGDVIHAIPLAAELRRTFQDCEIGWIVEERWAELLCAPGEPRSGTCSPARPVVDHVYTVSTRRWRRNLLNSNTWSEVAKVHRDLRAGQFHYVLDVQGAWKSVALARLSRGETVYGFASPRERGVELFYSRRVATHKAHVVEQNLEIAEALTGVAPSVARFELPGCTEAELWVDDQLRSRSIGSFAILNPGAGWGTKQWPAENFGEVARQLGAMGVHSLINFGPGEESLARRVAQASPNTAHFFLCSISQLIALMRKARLFVGGDTGPMHLAAALDVPVVALFGPTDPARNGPYGTRAVVVRNDESITSYRHVAGEDEGLMKVTPAEVVHAAQNLLMETTR